MTAGRFRRVFDSYAYAPVSVYQFDTTYAYKLFSSVRSVRTGVVLKVLSSDLREKIPWGWNNQASITHAFFRSRR